MNILDRLLQLEIPRLDFIVFELIEIDVEKLKKSTTYKPDVLSVVDLAIMPEALNYSIQSRDAVVQTDKKVFVQRYNYAPEKVYFSGTFGEDKRLVGGKWLDGWQRLKQFETLFVKLSKSYEKGKIYAINYYDFMFQRFGAINIESWKLSANARTNTQLINYSLEFSIVDKLITTTTKDAILKYLLVATTDRLNSDNLIKELSINGIDYKALALDIATGLQSAINELSNILQPLNIFGKITLKNGVF